MALIGTIRKNGWLLTAAMVLALGSFIIQVYWDNANSGNSDRTTLGKVNGTTIRYDDFDRYQKLIYSNADGEQIFGARDKAWDYFVKRALVSGEAEKIGLGYADDLGNYGISEGELNEIQFGNPGNISPILRERYARNGQMDMGYLNQVKQALDGGQLESAQPQFFFTWKEQEKEVVARRLEDKIVNMVTKGMYTPSWQAEMGFKESNERLDFKYVRVPYDKVADADAAVTDADYEKYLSENPRLYSQMEETRVISFVAFNVVPTTGDTAASRETVLKLVPSFRESKNDSLFMLTNGGTYEEKYKLKSALPAKAADSLLQKPLGTVVGPYLDNGVWAIAKILDRKVMPDSVSARHILLKTGTPGAEQKIDSFMNLIKTGKARFDSLAIRNSEDGSAVKGGSLGTFAEGAMVPEFNAICFYKGEVGVLYKVQTQFGWHLIEITNKKFIKNETGVKALFFTQAVEPSKATQRSYRERAQTMMQTAKNVDELTALATQQGPGVAVQSTKPLKSSDFDMGMPLTAGNDARAIIKWAFEDNVKVGTVNKELFIFRDGSVGFYDNRYVVAGLKSIVPSGKANVATLKSLPDAVAKVLQIKKAEIIKSKLQNPTDLDAIAMQWETKVDTARGTSMMQGGSEGRVIGTAFALAKDAVSAPIAGTGGVYILSPISDKTAAQVPADLTMFRRQMSSSAVVSVQTNLINAMKKAANVKDNRIKFF